MAPPTELPAKIAQLITVCIGSHLPPVRTAEDDLSRAVELVTNQGIGGIFVFNGSWPRTAATIARIRQSSHYPVLISTDMERGIGQQIRGTTLFPHARAFAQLGDEATRAVTEFARLAALQARQCGIQLALGPVADVDSSPQNPIIATRAFASQPDEVAELVRAYLRGADSAGLLTAAKHFPGHGDTRADSHHTLPVVNKSRRDLEAIEFVPFRAAIADDVPLIMSAHVAFPQLDPTGTAATFSPAILTDLLRGELGFEGAVISDSLRMAGAQQADTSEAEMAVRALQAGVDILLDVNDPKAVIHAVLAACNRGRIAPSRIDEALQRVWELKAQARRCEFMNHGFKSGSREFSESAVGIAAERLSRKVAREAIAVVHDQRTVRLPLDRHLPLTAILLKPHHFPQDPPVQPLAHFLRAKFAGVQYHELGPEFCDSDVERLAASLDKTRPVLVACIVKPAAWQEFGMHASHQALVEKLCRQQPVIVVSLGVAAVLETFGDAAFRLCTFSDVPVSQAALVAYLAGSEIPG